jgi:hypothetical protein
VPVSEVAAYIAMRHPDFSLEEREEFLELIQRLDDVFLRVTEKKDTTKEPEDGQGDT